MSIPTEIIPLNSINTDPSAQGAAAALIIGSVIMTTHAIAQCVGICRKKDSFTYHTMPPSPRVFTLTTTAIAATPVWTPLTAPSNALNQANAHNVSRQTQQISSQSPAKRRTSTHNMILRSHTAA